MKSHKFGTILALLVLGLAIPCVSQDSLNGRRLNDRTDPVLPEVAQQMHLVGAVRLQVTILSSGVVRDIKILGGHPLLAEAAVKAVQSWRWESGRDETKTLTIDFKKN